MGDASKVTLSKTGALPGAIARSQAFWIALFACATALGARAEIPHEPVPFTLQTMAVLLAGAFLGPRNGALSQIAYLAAGAAGVPVFAGGASGLLAFVGPTGGYLLAFPLAAAAVGFLAGRRLSRAWSALTMGAGLLVIFSLGTLHLYAFTLHDFGAAVTSGFLIFTWWDMLKLVAAAMIYFEVARRWKRVPAGG